MRMRALMKKPLPLLTVVSQRGLPFLKHNTAASRVPAVSTSKDFVRCLHAQLAAVY